MAEVAHRVHPRILDELCPSTKEVIALLINIQAIREWFDALEQGAPRSRGGA
jgi:hypothetical protein